MTKNYLAAKNIPFKKNAVDLGYASAAADGATPGGEPAAPAEEEKKD